MNEAKCDLCHDVVPYNDLISIYIDKRKHMSIGVSPYHGDKFILPAYVVCAKCAEKLEERQGV